MFEIWYLNTSLSSDSGVVRTWCTAANTALSEGSLTMFPLHSLDKDCSTVLKYFSLQMKCCFFVLGCCVFFVSHVKKWLGFQFSNHQVCREQNVKYRKVQFLKDGVSCVFITYQKIIQSTQLSFCYRNNICCYSLQLFKSQSSSPDKKLYSILLLLLLLFCIVLHYIIILYSFLPDDGCYIRICREM